MIRVVRQGLLKFVVGPAPLFAAVRHARGVAPQRAIHHALAEDPLAAHQGDGGGVGQLLLGAVADEQVVADRQPRDGGEGQNVATPQ